VDFLNSYGVQKFSAADEAGTLGQIHLPRRILVVYLARAAVRDKTAIEEFHISG
jgi:hypothetical protein